MGPFDQGWEAAAPPEAGSKELVALLHYLVSFLPRFVVLTQAQVEVIALWLFHTHAIEAFRVTPYLRVASAEKGSGKTLLLEVCSLLACRPWLTGRVSAAVLPRKVEAECPTLLLDESDAAFGGEREYAEALRGILNSGYRRSGKTSLCVGQGASLSYRDFSTFCPKALAGLRSLPDTVADRSIPIHMKRMAPGETVEDLYDDGVADEASKLRVEMERLAGLSLHSLRQVKPTRLLGMSPRSNEVTRPLLAVAALAGPEWSERARSALLELVAGKGGEDQSTGVRLLGDIRAVLGGSDRISSNDLCNALAEIEEAPWADSNKGKPLSPNGLARLLKPFGIASRTIRFASGETAKGYYRASFEEDWTRYLPPPDPGNVTTSQPTSRASFLGVSNPHTDDVVTDDKREIANIDGPCDAVTDDPLLPGMDGYRVGFDL